VAQAHSIHSLIHCPIQPQPPVSFPTPHAHTSFLFPALHTRPMPPAALCCEALRRQPQVAQALQGASAREGACGVAGKHQQQLELQLTHLSACAAALSCHPPMPT